MSYKSRVFLLVLVAVVFGVADCATAQKWARDMFKEQVHDFGDVTLGEVPEYRFELQNIYKEDIRIRSVTSSCGCTIATPSKTVLKTWEKGEIICRFNTPAVGNGVKQATVTVRFDRPTIGEYQLTVKGRIGSGVSFSPASIDFGQVTDSNLPEKKVMLTSSGSSNLRVADVKSTFGHIKVSLREASRRANQVSYEMTAQLKDSVPKGFAQGELYVVVEEFARDGKRMVREIPLKFNAKVVAPLQITPSVLTLDAVETGKEVNKKVVVSSAVPFKITDVRCESESFRVRANTSDSKKIHIVEVFYTGEEKSGRHEYDLNFFTDLSKESATKLTTIVEVASN